MQGSLVQDLVGKLRSHMLCDLALKKKQWKQWLTLFWGAPKSLQMLTGAMKLRRLLLRRKVMTNLDSILKSREISLSTKVDFVKAKVFPEVLCGYENWTIKNAEHQRIDALNCAVGEDS